MVHAAGLHLGCYFGGLTFGVETAVERSQLLDGLLVGFELLGGYAGLGMAQLNVFSLLLLPHEGHQHLVGKLIDHFQLILAQLHRPVTAVALGLTHPVHIELMFVVEEGQALDAEGMTAGQQDEYVLLSAAQALSLDGC